MCGSGYVVEHCVTAFIKSQKDKLYQVYITDALKLIAENTAAYAGGKSPSIRWVEKLDSMGNNDVVDPDAKADEIITNIVDKISKL